MTTNHFFIFAFFLILSFSSCTDSSRRFSDKEAEQLNTEIQSFSKSLITNPDRMDGFLKDDDLRLDFRDNLSKFYERRDYKLAWITLDKLLPPATDLLEQINRANEHGLDSASYNLYEIERLASRLFSDSIDEDDIAREYVHLDWLLTATYFTYASHMHKGVVDPEKADSNWYAYPKKKDWALYLSENLQGEKIAKSIEALAPGHPQYSLLKDKLAQYRTLAEADTFPDRLPPSIDVEPGDSSEVVGMVKRMLTFWGDLSPEDLEAQEINIYDKPLEAAIAEFQARHGILEDGRLGPETIGMLNTPIQKRIDQISLNMERLRWLPDELGDHYLWVNIPDYQLKVMKKGDVDLEMRVIVGESMNETPIFSDTMEYLVFSPTWTVPESISKEEMLPKIQEDENYFKENNLVVYESWAADAKEIDPEEVKWKKIDPEEFTYKIVERPGDKNALGSVKFMFPNSEAIYLHDTPTDHLFENTERGFSHGCVRVEKPKDLAAYLLEENDEKWDLEKITEHMALDTPTTITLKQRLPVHIVYHSAWVDEKERIHFRKDIYNHDRTQEQAIERKEELLM